MYPSPAIVVGGGLAGMFTALRIAAHRDVVLVTKGAIGEGSTAWAQGGIAAAVGADDTVAAHVLDTLEAGAGLADPDVARAVCTDGPARIADLAALGVAFDRAGDYLARAREWCTPAVMRQGATSPVRWWPRSGPSHASASPTAPGSLTS